MKKIIAIIAAIALIATMSVAAFAATPCAVTGADPFADAPNAQGLHNDDNHDVYVDLTGVLNNTICVVVTWDDMKFTYDGELTWNPHTLQYEGTVQGDYAGNGTIKFDNYSDVPVTITAAYADDTNTSDVGGKFDEAATTKTWTDVAAVDQTNDNAITSVTTEFLPTGIPTINDNGYIVVGNITITVAA